VLQDTAFQAHTYKHTTMGFLRDIVKMPRQFDYSLEFFRRWYRPEHVTILIVGDVQPDQAAALVQKHFGGWQRGGHTVTIPPEPPQEKPLACHVPWETETEPWVVVAFKAPAFSPRDKDVAALRLLFALAFSEDSPLYEKLFVREQKVSALQGYVPDTIDPFMMMALARVRQVADCQTVLDEMLATFEACAARPPDEAELRRAKANARYSFTASLDSSEGIADALAPYLARGRTPAVVDELYATFERVTPADLQQAAQKYFAPERRTIATLAHGEEAPAAARSNGSAANGESRGTVLLPSDSPLVSFRLTFACGAADDPADKPGLAYVTANLLAKGSTATMSYEQIVEALFPMAASVDVTVDKHMTTFSGTVHRDNLEGYWAILKSMLLSPAFKEEDLERVKRNTCSFLEVDLRGNNDEELGKEVLYNEIYAGHPYGRHNAGSLAGVTGITLDDARRFHRKHHRIDRLVIGLAGRYGDGFVDRVRSELGAGLAGDGVEPVQAELPQPAAIERSRLTIVRKKTRATGIHVGFPIDVTRAHEDWVALAVMQSYFGEHRSENSHLYQRLREVRGLNYGDYAYIEYFPRGMFQFQPDPNLVRPQQIFQIWIRPVPPENGPFAFRAALFELEKLVREGLSPEAFEATRTFLGKRAPLLVKTQDRRLGYAIDSAAYGVGDYVQTLRAGLARLTLEDVNRAIKRHLRSDRLQMVVVTEDAEGFRDAVTGAGPNAAVYQAAPAADVLEEDKVIERFPTGLAAGDVKIVDVADVFAR
jgi:zinc protease